MSNELSTISKTSLPFEYACGHRPQQHSQDRRYPFGDIILNEVILCQLSLSFATSSHLNLSCVPIYFHFPYFETFSLFLHALLHVQHFHDAKAWQNFRSARFVSLINESQFLTLFLIFCFYLSFPSYLWLVGWIALCSAGVEVCISMKSKLQQLRKWNESIY